MIPRSSVGTALAVVGAVSMAVAQSPSPYDRTTTGIVVDTQGRPIADVTVNAANMAVATTAADGTYRLEGAADVIRFFKHGYRPATRAVETLSDRVVLERAVARARVLPACTGARASWQDVGALRLPTPKEATRHRVDDDDSFMSIWEFRDGQLRHGSGPMWSYGFPSSTELRGLTDVQEAHVRRPMTLAPASLPDEDLVLDIRGTRPNGRRYRFVGVFMETFRYDDATPEQAAVFDRMLDAMCSVSGPFQRPGRR